MPSKNETAVRKAFRLRDTGKHVAAFREFKRLAEAGEESAFQILGYLYDVGEGTRRSRKSAMRWYLLAYYSGDGAGASAASNIATMYRDVGDRVKEFEWYQRAASLGDGDAMLEVGLRYLSGKGVSSSLKRAVDLFRAVLITPDTTEASRDAARQLLHACPTK